jgi:hypothetical protein
LKIENHDFLRERNNPTSKKENVMIFVSPEAKQDLIAR